MSSMLENSTLFDWPNNSGAIDVKMDGSVLEEESSFGDCGSHIIYVAKAASQKIEALIRSMKFLSPEVVLYLYKSTMWACMKYYCHVWVGAPNCYLEILYRLQKQVYRTVCPSLAAFLEPLVHH